MQVLIQVLPTFPLHCGHFSTNAGKWYIHGAYWSIWVCTLIQGGPLPILNGVATPISRVSYNCSYPFISGHLQGLNVHLY